MRRILLCVLMLIASPLHAAEQLKVVASFSILADFVRNVGGDRINLTTLVGADSDVHVYAPAPSDAKRIADAKLVIVNGLGLEGWLPRLVQSSGSKAQVVIVSAGIAPLKLGSAADPHGWQSVPNAKIYVTDIANALAAVDPDDAEFFRARAKAYLEKLETLDREVRAAVAKIPQERRKVISTHDAFGYFAAEYGVQFIAPLGVSTETEPSARGHRHHHRPDQGPKNPSRVPGKYQRRPADPADRGGDRLKSRRDPDFGRFDRRKGACTHLH
ncbi:zinc/manganese transport system substrate-binding protein [Bradyrhizobium sp. GM5.1]